MEFTTWRGRVQRELRCSGIYIITNLINGKIYIGQSLNMHDRWKSHRQSVSDVAMQTPLVLAFREFGFDNFRIDVLEYCEPCDLNAREIYHIEAFHSCVPNGYNVTRGGSKPHVVVPRARPSSLVKKDSAAYLANASPQPDIPLLAGDKEQMEAMLSPYRETLVGQEQVPLYFWDESYFFWQRDVPVEHLVGLIAFAPLIGRPMREYLLPVPAGNVRVDVSSALFPSCMVAVPSNSLLLSLPYMFSSQNSLTCPVLWLDQPPMCSVSL